MKKYLVAATMLVALAGQANAWDHRRHNPPPRHHHYGINPWVAGALGLGILGAGTYLYNNRQCWDEPVVDRFGYQVFDQFGRPMVRRICN